MKKSKAKSGKDTMRPEYDFRGGIRGKHAAKHAQGTNIVVLDPDVAGEFKSSKEVNETLRAVLRLVRTRNGRQRHKSA